MRHTTSIFQSGDDTAGPGKQHLAGRGQDYLSAGAFEECDIMFLLQPCDLVAQRGLRDLASSCGAGEVEFISQGDEILQLPNVHLGDGR